MCLKDEFTVFEVCLHQVSYMNIEAGIASCDHSSCCYLPWRDPSQFTFSFFSVMREKNQQSFFCASYIPKFSRESNTKRYFCPKISHLELQQLVLTIPLFVPHHFHWNCFEYLFRPLNSRNDYSKHNQLQCSCRPLTIVFKQTSKIVNRPFNIIK